jgi:hypothetical protein
MPRLGEEECCEQVSKTLGSGKLLRMTPIRTKAICQKPCSLLLSRSFGPMTAGSFLPGHKAWRRCQRWAIGQAEWEASSLACGTARPGRLPWRACKGDHRSWLQFCSVAQDDVPSSTRPGSTGCGLPKSPATHCYCHYNVVRLAHRASPSIEAGCNGPSLRNNEISSFEIKFRRLQ